MARDAGKWAGEVIGINEHCFDVTGSRGTHCSGCSTAMKVRQGGAPVRESPVGLGDRFGARGESPRWCDAGGEVSRVGELPEAAGDADLLAVEAGDGDWLGAGLSDGF
jgi:hypothetical protein